MNMSAEERRRTPPWATEDVPRNQQIVRFANTEPAASSITPIRPGVQIGGEPQKMMAGAEQFIRERIGPSDNAMPSIGSIHKAYAEWATANGLPSLTEGQFLLLLRNSGYAPSRLAGHTRFEVEIK
jgi:hypothetical protein